MELTQVNPVHPTSAHLESGSRGASPSGQAAATRRSPRGCRDVAVIRCTGRMRTSTIDSAGLDPTDLRQRDDVVRLAADALGGRVFGRRIAILGASPGPSPDDTGVPLSHEVATRLRGLGADVAVYSHRVDDMATGPATPAAVRDRDDALRDADVVIVTTWDHEASPLSPEREGGLVRGRIIVDVSGALNAAAWRAAGWQHVDAGRP